VLVNNAGSSTRAGLLSGSLEDIRLEIDTHYFGTLNAIRAFAPVIEGNGGGAILNMLSVLSWLHLPGSGAYGAAKAAAWAMSDPSLVAKLALDGLFAGLPEVLADDLTRSVKAQLSSTA
jgi:NAD(P)-dependent dehydrogenase (short-subunit alcohol dehydrogenase family)